MPRDEGPKSGHVRVATWNIHGGIGRDGRYDAARIVEVLHELNSDIVALQEVASLELHGEFLTELTQTTGFHVVAGPTLSRSGSDYGNALLSRFPIDHVDRIDLAVRDFEPRGALDARIAIGPRAVRVLATHLGLRPSERREQVRRILAAIECGDAATTVLMGDVNEWYLWGRPLRWLHAHFRSTPAPATFPAHRPVFALDRIWLHPAASLRRLAVHATPLARMASDHLPLTAEFALPTH